MRNVNKVILIGNLTRDPEMRRTNTEQYVTTFGMATNRDWVTKDMRKQQSTEFHELVCWGRLAEIANMYIRKGHLVYVEGYLKTRSWDDASGVKKFRTEITVEDLIMLEKRPKNGPEPNIENEKATVSEETEPQPSISVEDPFTI